MKRLPRKHRIYLIKLITAVVKKLSFLFLLIAFAEEAVAPVEVARLTSEKPQAMINFSVEKSGEVEMTINVSAPGTDWGIEGAESAVLTLYLGDDSVRPGLPDGYNQDIVLFKGEEIFGYQVMLGYLPAGEHQLKFFFNEEKSREDAQEIIIYSYNLTIHTPEDPDYLVYQYAPIFYGRDDNTYTDVPLLMWHESSKNAQGFTRLRYGMIWSNEDGGTPIIDLLGIYGRPTDIEWMYEVILDTTNKLKESKYHAVGHRHIPFAGEQVGGHAVLRVASLNNNFSDEGKSKLLFRFSPRLAIPEEFRDEIAESCLREILMDENPYIWEVAFKEIQREGKVEEEADWQTKNVSDLRNYVYIDYKTEVPPEARELFNGYYVSRDVELQFGVKFKGTEQWYTSDHDSRTKRPSKEIWARIAIEVPTDSRTENIESIRVKIYPKGHPEDYELVLTDITKVFMLKEKYSPGVSIFSWKGKVVLNRDKPEIVFKME